MLPDRRRAAGRVARPARRLLGILLGLTCVNALAAPSSGGESAFRVTRTSQIGGEGSWDYAEYDAVRHRLFVARVGGILVLDTNSMKPVGTIPARAGTRTHGVALANDLGLGMTSDGDDQVSTVFDLSSLAPLRRVLLGYSPDSILYDPASRKGVAFDGGANLAVAFDPSTGKVTARVKLPGSPEAPAADGEGKLYVNLSDKSEIATINTHTWSVEGH